MKLLFSFCLCFVVAAYVERQYDDDDLYSEANDLLNPFDAEDYDYRHLLDADEDAYQGAYDYENNGFKDRMLKPKGRFGPRRPSGGNRRPMVKPSRGRRPGRGRVDRQPIGASIKGGSGRRQPGGGRKPGGPRGPGGPKSQGGSKGLGGPRNPKGSGGPRSPGGPRGPGRNPAGPRNPCGNLGGSRCPGGNSGGSRDPGGIPIPLPPPPTRVSQPPPTKTTRPPKADIQTNPGRHPIGPPRPPPPYKPYPEPIPQPPPTKATKPPKVTDSPEFKTCKQSFWSKLDPRKRCRGGCLHECAQELLPNGGHCDQCDERCCEYNCRGIDCISVEVKKVLDLATIVRDFFTTTTNGYSQGDNNPATEAPYVPGPDPPAEQGEDTAETEEPPTGENTDGESNGDQEQEQGENTAEPQEPPTKENPESETNVDQEQEPDETGELNPQEQGEKTAVTEEPPTEENPESEANVDEEQEHGEETEEPSTDENPESQTNVDQEQEPDKTGELNPGATNNDGTDTLEKTRQLEFDYVPYPQPNFDVSGFSDGEELQGDYVPYPTLKFDTDY